MLGRSNIPQPTAAAFRSTFGLATNPPTITVVGTDPRHRRRRIGSPARHGNGRVRWPPVPPCSSSRAHHRSPAPVLTPLALYAVDNNIGDILTLSYGECESDGTAAGTAFWNTLWQQAAAQGQTVFVSAGDTGAAGCDAPTNTVASEGLRRQRPGLFRLQRGSRRQHVRRLRPHPVLVDEFRNPLHLRARLHA